MKRNNSAIFEKCPKAELIQAQKLHESQHDNIVTKENTKHTVKKLQPPTTTKHMTVNFVLTLHNNVEIALITLVGRGGGSEVWCHAALLQSVIVGLMQVSYRMQLTASLFLSILIFSIKIEATSHRFSSMPIITLITECTSGKSWLFVAPIDYTRCDRPPDFLRKILMKLSCLFSGTVGKLLVSDWLKYLISNAQLFFGNHPIIRDKNS